MAGSAPAICTEIGSASPSWLARRWVLALPYSRELDVTISETASPAPSFLHSWRKGRSVTPAMGATNRLFRKVNPANCIGEARLGKSSAFYPKGPREGRGRSPSMADRGVSLRNVRILHAPLNACRMGRQAGAELGLVLARIGQYHGHPGRLGGAQAGGGGA